MAELPIVEAESLTYGTPAGRTLASGLSFRLMPRQLLMVSGPNGSGKSTLLKVAFGGYPIRAGSIRVNVPRHRIAYIPQMQNPDFHLPLTLRDVLRISDRSVGASLRSVYDETQALEIGLLEPSHLELAWNTASGGERKRTLFTRALLRNPDLLVLDEPMNHLDRESRAKIIAVLHRFLTDPARRSPAVMLVSHEPITPEELPAAELVSLALGLPSEG